MNRLTITAPRNASNVRIGRVIWHWLKQRVRNTTYAFDGATVRVCMPFAGATDLGYALDATTAWNVLALKAEPLPSIYDGSVVYAREPQCRSADGSERMCEEFVTAHEVRRRGFGDCDDLGCWLAAQRRLEGEQAQAIPKPSAVGWHIVVRRGDGSLEDPSARLGMPVP